MGIVAGASGSRQVSADAGHRYLGGGSASRPDPRPLRLRWPDQRREFPHHVEQVLPTLKPDDIVILDISARKKADAVPPDDPRHWGAAVLLPPYIPDLTPIEQVFGKLETLLRKVPNEPWNTGIASALSSGMLQLPRQSGIRLKRN
jgi:hypothetical protein